MPIDEIDTAFLQVGGDQGFDALMLFSAMQGQVFVSQSVVHAVLIYDRGTYQLLFVIMTAAEMFERYFSVQVFFLIFREVLESAVIVSVLLSFLRHALLENTENGDKALFRKLFWQVWAGAATGVLLCLVIGGIFLFIFYTLGKNLWDTTERIWEGVFCIVASLIISWMGLAMLRVNKMKYKWRNKLAHIIAESHQAGAEDEYKWYQIGRYTKRHAMFVLPMVTTLREGLEAVAFVGGLGASQPSSSFALAALAAVILGFAVGVAMYKYGNHVSITYFLVGSTCFLYLVAAGLFSRGVWFFEMEQFVRRVGQDVSETGSGPGSYDITHSVWHVNCCNPESDGVYMLLNAILGWQNSATYASVASYNLYWITVMFVVFVLARRERQGLQGKFQPNPELIREAEGLLTNPEQPRSSEDV